MVRRRGVEQAARRAQVVRDDVAERPAAAGPRIGETDRRNGCRQAARRPSRLPAGRPKCWRCRHVKPPDDLEALILVCRPVRTPRTQLAFLSRLSAVVGHVHF